MSVILWVTTTLNYLGLHALLLVTGAHCPMMLLYWLVIIITRRLSGLQIIS